MEMLQKIWESYDKRPSYFNLLLLNVLGVIFLVWFANVGVLPLANLADFALVVFLGLVLALYRPSWTFLLFVGSLALENINLAPASLGWALRPYQFWGALTVIAVVILKSSGRQVVPWPKWVWADALPGLLVLGGFVGAFSEGSGALKMAVISTTFLAWYFLVRLYVQDREDLKKVAPFFLSTAGVVVLYAIWQNWRFVHGAAHFEVMPGRPNGTFMEPDWLGGYLVFILAIILSFIFKNKESLVIGHWSSKKQIENDGLVTDCRLLVTKKVAGKALLCLLIIFVSVALIITVARSAWLGAIIITLGFLKVILIDQGLSPKLWQGKAFGKNLLGILLGLFLAIGIIKLFGLSNFQLGSRAVSTGGLQEITIACANPDIAVPQKIANLEELKRYSCRHIDLEVIEQEAAAGNTIRKVERPDPNVGLRSRIYQTAFAQIKAQPLLGIGWGKISDLLGQDANGNGLNASNIFLETWLGAGLLGFAALVVLCGYIFVQGVRQYFVGDRGMAVFVLLGLFAILIPNLFNAGIFLAFVWAFWAVAVSLLSVQKK